MNIFAAFRERIDESIRELIQQGVVNDNADLSRISVEPPREASHGDMATNAAMVLGKFSELQPRDLAGKIADLLSEDKDIAAIDIAEKIDLGWHLSHLLGNLGHYVAT